MIWERLSFIRIPMSLCLLMVLILSIWATVRTLRSETAAELKTKVWVDAVFIWGFLAFLSGLLGTSVGLIRAFQGAEAAGTFWSPLAAPGIVPATLSPTLGTAIFGLAAFVWFLLQHRWRLLRAEIPAGEEPEAAVA
ncbi:MAG: hypothetical protein OEO23_04745 [Gemmatimonadota bacterium]|nr:hypothetical protein [Gemmatimonadota bacterium]